MCFRLWCIQYTLQQSECCDLSSISKLPSGIYILWTLVYILCTYALKCRILSQSIYTDFLDPSDIQHSWGYCTLLSHPLQEVVSRHYYVTVSSIALHLVYITSLPPSYCHCWEYHRGGTSTIDNASSSYIHQCTQNISISIIYIKCLVVTQCQIKTVPDEIDIVYLKDEILDKVHLVPVWHHGATMWSTNTM